MRVEIYIGVSSGLETKVFDELVKTDDQLRRLEAIMLYARDLELAFEAYVETLGEEPEKP